ncbi:MAG: ABC transporter permease [Candidatus Rokubacteria bacterium]|nr:ABC transporter permease [Candidatus Rokubacteria bacterium]MBI3109211.1 ABC transporter permease [Candidatus Rokubacteria bacterium]
MRTYVLRRLVLFVPTLLGVSILIFVLMRLVPGDIAEILVYQSGSESSAIQHQQIRQIRQELGLDRPVVVQYLAWMGGALRGDFGQSYMQRRPVSDILRERVPRSIELALLTLSIAVVWAVPLGVVSAVRQNGALDYLARVVSLSGLSLPLFVTGALILYGLGRIFRWMPPLEFVSFTENPLENLKQLIWPALCQAYYISAPISRLTRSEMLEVIRQDYVRTARAKGLRERAVVYRHALRNSLLPVVTFIGWWGGRLLGGLVIMELIFVVPGMGTALVQAVSQRDYPTVQAMIFVMALVFLAVNLVVDLAYAWLDPRIRYA